MNIIEPHSRINPPEDPVPEPEGVIVRPIPLPRDGETDRRPVRAQRGRHRAESRSWPSLLNRVLRSWPATLRLALLLAILLVGLAVIVAAAGIATPFLVIAGGYQARRWFRRDDRTKRT